MKITDEPKRSKIRSILSENNRLTKAISVLFLIMIMVGLFAFIIFGLHKFGLIEIKLPAFIQNIFFKPAENDSETEKDDGNLYDYLWNYAKTYGNVSENGGFSIELTRENIRDAIANIPMPDYLYLETTAKYYDTNGTNKVLRTEEMSLWKKGEKYAYTLSVNSELKDSYINDSKTELIINHQTGSRLERPAAEAFSFDSIPHVQNINHYFHLLENGEINNFYLRQENNSNIIQIKYLAPQLNQSEMIYIYLDTGIVKEVQTSAGEHNDLFYHCITAVYEAYYEGDEKAAAKSLIQDSFFEIK